jgi:hypothetical protein
MLLSLIVIVFLVVFCLPCPPKGTIPKSQLHPLNNATTWGLPSLDCVPEHALGSYSSVVIVPTEDRDTWHSWNPGTVVPFGE